MKSSFYCPHPRYYFHRNYMMTGHCKLGHFKLLHRSHVVNFVSRRPRSVPFMLRTSMAHKKCMSQNVIYLYFIGFTVFMYLLWLGMLYTPLPVHALTTWQCHVDLASNYYPISPNSINSIQRVHNLCQHVCYECQLKLLMYNSNKRFWNFFIGFRKFKFSLKTVSFKRMVSLNNSFFPIHNRVISEINFFVKQIFAYFN